MTPLADEVVRIRRAMEELHEKEGLGLALTKSEETLSESYGQTLAAADAVAAERQVPDRPVPYDGSGPKHEDVPRKSAPS